MSFKISVNQKPVEIDYQSFDVAKMGPDHYHIIADQQSFHARILDLDLEGGAVTVEVNQEIFEVQLADPYDQLVEQLGLTREPSNVINELVAPMPGMVLQVLVSPGDQVNTGDPLVILEAMKMENLLKSPGPANIESIMIKEGDVVDKSQILIRFS